MLEVIAGPREEVSDYAPKMYRIQINPELIGTVIGPGGKMIRKIQEEAGGATIDIEEDGTVFVGGINETVARKAIAMIEGLTKEVRVGEVYTGKVTRLLNFGAFVEILPGKEGLVHISQLGEDHIDTVEDEVSVGDEVTVMVTEIDNLGRINLSRRAVLLGEEPPTAPSGGGGDGGSRGRGGLGGRGGGGDRQRGGGGGGGGARPSASGGGGGGTPARRRRLRQPWRRRRWWRLRRRPARAVAAATAAASAAAAAALPLAARAAAGCVATSPSAATAGGPPAPPPPPRRGLGGAPDYDDE